jgi:diguanylate cyclase (GGDEF)-like protein
LSALNHAQAPYGFLYADEPRSELSGAADLEMLANLSAIAAVASQNALIFERAQELASRDPLTGLLNRRALHERLQQELESCRRHATSSLVYLLLDVDDFKQVNDRTGHAAGDALLYRLAEALTTMSRAQDVVARIGGDEFVIVMLDADPRLAVSSVARISELLKLQGFHCSVGAALYPRDGLDASTLTWAADRALYIAKAAGKDRFAFA